MFVIKRLFTSLLIFLHQIHFIIKLKLMRLSTANCHLHNDVASIVKYIGTFFLTLNIAHTYSLCSVLKNTGQCMYVIT
jgi:hypothetical protein